MPETRIFNGTTEVDVNIQDQVTEPLDPLFIQSISEFTISADTGQSGIDAPSFIYDFEAAAGHGISAGNEILLLDTATESSFYALALNVAVNTITLDRMIDHNFTFASTLGRVVNGNMAVDGSVTPQIFTVRAGTIPADYTRYIMTMQCSTLPDNSKFGNLPALTRGLVYRICNGFQKTVFNFKTNLDIEQFCYDTKITPKSGAGNATFGARLSFAGPEKHGVAIRVQDESVTQWVVQDNLLALISARVAAQGHLTSREISSIVSGGTALRKILAIDDTTNADVSIPRHMWRREATMINDGPNRLWFAFNEPAVAGQGLYADPGQVVNLSRLKGESDLYLGCSSGETASAYVQL